MTVAAAGALSRSSEALSGAERSAAGVFAIRVGGAALGYGTQVLLARSMGEAGYGVFATVWVWLAVLGHASLWGLSQSLCRFLPYHRVRGELDLARGFLAAGAAVTLASATVVAGLGGAILWFGQDTIGAAYVSPFALALLVLPVFALQDYVEGVARSFNWTALAIAPPFILRQAIIAGSMITAMMLGAPPTPDVAIACTLLATTATVVVQTTLLLIRMRKVLPWGSLAYSLRTWTMATLPIAFVDLTLSAFGFIDVVLLGLFMPAEAVGLYFAATRIQQLVLFAQYAATAATSARFAEAWARRDHATLRALVQRTVRLTSLATLALGGGLLLVAPLLLALFGPGFGASYAALAVLVAGVVVQSFFGPAEDLLNMLGAERVCATVSVVTLAAAVILNLALIPIYGLMGAATAMAIAYVLRGLALAVAARLRLGISTHLFARSA